MTPYLYTVNPDADEPIMLIDRHIGFDEADGFGIMGDMFQKELLALDGQNKKRIQVWINSPGGIVSDGYAIYNAILKSNTKVDTYCFGMAASIAGVIFQAGRNRIMADYSWLMFHNPSGGSTDTLHIITDSLITMIAARSGKTNDDVRAIMNKTTFILSGEALSEGLCDRVEVSSDHNRKRTITTDEKSIKAFHKEANLIVNKILESKNPIKMIKVTNKLNLNPDASEESIVKEIEAIQNKSAEQAATITRQQTEVSNKAAELEAVKNQLSEKEAELKAIKDKVEADEQAAKIAAEAAKAEKAKNLIDGFVTDGRVKNDEAQIALWTKNAISDYEGTKNMLENLPINKKAVTTTVNNHEGATHKYSFAGAMIEISNKIK